MIAQSIACGGAGLVLALIVFSPLWLMGAGWDVIVAGAIGCGVGCFFIPIIQLAMLRRPQS